MLLSGSIFYLFEENIKICDKTIIGASSVIGSDVEARAAATGNPAEAIRKKFDDELIEVMKN